MLKNTVVCTEVMLSDKVMYILIPAILLQWISKARGPAPPVADSPRAMKLILQPHICLRVLHYQATPWNSL